MKSLPPKKSAKPARPRLRLTAAEKRQVAELLPKWKVMVGEIQDLLEAAAATIVSVLYAGDAEAAFRGDYTRLADAFLRLGEAGDVPFSANLQSVMRRIGALNLLIRTEKWHDLDWGQKTELLRLKTLERIIAGAKHVDKYELRRSQVRKYVDAILEAAGEPKPSRHRSLASATDDVAGFAGRFGPDAIEKIGTRFDDADEASQAAMLRALDEAEVKLASLRRRLKPRKRSR